MGKTVEYDTEFKNSISDEVVGLSPQVGDHGFRVVAGDTMACDDFYEGIIIIFLFIVLTAFSYFSMCELPMTPKCPTLL